MVDQALSGVKVLDLSQYIAGPYCTKLLADFGAEVIKIEDPQGGDGARRIGPFPKDDPDPEKSGLFLHLNTNKKSITLNIRCRTGIEILNTLVKEADILVESLKPEVISTLGLSYEIISEINPRLIMVSISSFGQSGPYRDYRANDMAMLAMGGLMYITGDADREPLRTGGSQAQYATGVAALASTMLAFYGRDEVGVGEHVDVSTMETIVANLESTLLNYGYYGAISGRGWHRHAPAWPVDVYPCRDGYFVLAASGVGGTGLTNLALLVERPDLVDHPLFSPFDPRPRMEASLEEFDSFLLPWFTERSKMEIVEKAQELKLAFAPVVNTDELLSDPQLKSRSFFTEMDHPIAGKLTYTGAPFKMSETPWYGGRAPLLGEHNEEVYCQRLGYSRRDLVLLRGCGCI